MHWNQTFLSSKHLEWFQTKLSTFKHHKWALQHSRNSIHMFFKFQTPPKFSNNNQPMLQNANPLRSTLQLQSNQFFSLFTWMSGLITYWNSIRLEIILCKHIHIYKGMWTMLGVKWIPPTNLVVWLQTLLFLLLQLYNYEQSNATPSTKPITYPMWNPWVSLKHINGWLEASATCNMAHIFILLIPRLNLEALLN